MKIVDLVPAVPLRPERLEDLLAAFRGQARGPGRIFRPEADEIAPAEARARPLQIPAELRHRINSYPQPCICVGSDGIIKLANMPATFGLSLRVSQSIDACGYVAEGGESLSACVNRILQDRSAEEGMAYLRCHHEESQKTATLAVLPTRRGDSSGMDALVFVIDPRWTHGMRDLVAEMYHLTEAEIDILFLFLDGLSIDEVAKARDRSRATIRTQFNMILSKCGIQRQTHLMRELLLSLSFSGHVRPLERTVSHPHRREFQLLRPGGRCVDLTLAGDMAGDLAMFLTVPCMHGFSPRIEAGFRDAGLCVASLARPGYGRTDPPPPGQSTMDCLTGDIDAVLQQMNKTEVTLIASRNSLLPALDYAARRPQTVRNILSINTQPPRVFYDRCGMDYGSPVMQTAEAANRCSTELMAHVVRTAVQAWASLGTRRYASIALDSARVAASTADEADQRTMFDEGVETSTRQGIEAVVADFPPLLADWREKVAACPCPITILHGAADTIYPVEPVRAMRDAFADKITLVEIAGGDRQFYISQRDVLVDHLRRLTAVAGRG